MTLEEHKDDISEHDDDMSSKHPSFIELEGFFSKSLCEELLKRSDQIVRTSPLPEYARFLSDFDEPDRDYFSDWDLVCHMKSALRHRKEDMNSCPHLQQITHDTDWSDIVTWTRYSEGQAISPHCDFVTSLIVYLNDDFGGGETIFLSPKVAVSPKQGKAVLLTGDVEHYGDVVTHKSKYIIRFITKSKCSLC